MPMSTYKVSNAKCALQSHKEYAAPRAYPPDLLLASGVSLCCEESARWTSRQAAAPQALCQKTGGCGELLHQALLFCLSKDNYEAEQTEC